MGPPARHRLSAAHFRPKLFFVFFHGDNGMGKNPRFHPIWSHFFCKLAKNTPYPPSKSLTRLKLLHLQRERLVKPKNFLQKLPWQIQLSPASPRRPIEALQRPYPAKFSCMYLVELTVDLRLCSHVISFSSSESPVVAPLPHSFPSKLEFPVVTVLFSPPEVLARFPAISV